MDGFIMGFVVSTGWVILLVPIYLVKTALRMTD